MLISNFQLSADEEDPTEVNNPRCSKIPFWLSRHTSLSIISLFSISNLNNNTTPTTIEKVQSRESPFSRTMVVSLFRVPLPNKKKDKTINFMPTPRRIFTVHCVSTTEGLPRNHGLKSLCHFLLKERHFAYYCKC